jgi:hypothetical protein
VRSGGFVGRSGKQSFAPDADDGIVPRRPADLPAHLQKGGVAGHGGTVGPGDRVAIEVAAGEAIALRRSGARR